jgi:hypothetical protein
VTSSDDTGREARVPKFLVQTYIPLYFYILLLKLDALKLNKWENRGTLEPGMNQENWISRDKNTQARAQEKPPPKVMTFL